ncbi:MAG: FHA domain-containing protein [Planctomycetaceae bacterium]
MQILLRVNIPDKPEKKVKISRNVTIGREKGRCDLRIASQEVSRKHCQILVGEYAVLVRDLDSANGTRVNGERIPAQTNFPLNSGDTIAVGPLTICAELMEDSFAGESEDEFLSQDDALAALDTPGHDAELSSLDILIENRLVNASDDYTSMQPTITDMPAAKSPAENEPFSLQSVGNDAEPTGKPALNLNVQQDIEDLGPQDDLVAEEDLVPVEDLGPQDDLVAEEDLVPVEDLGPQDDLVAEEDLVPQDQASGNDFEQAECEQTATPETTRRPQKDELSQNSNPDEDGLTGFLNQFD